MTKQPPTAAQHAPSGDPWWHSDFLDLMAHRLNLGACRNVLELGAGKGNWSELVLDRCAPDARLTAVDRDKRCIAAIERRFTGNPRVTAVQADVMTLPLRPGSYDLVTCQALLIHVSDVAHVLAEAFDLLAPGGLFLAAEPNHFANRLALNSVSAKLTPEEFGQIAALWWAFEKGHEALGMGRECIAVRLPELIYAAGFKGLSVYENDRAFVLAPPYDSRGERTAITDWLAAPVHAEDVAAREHAQHLAVAGGLSEAAFAKAWDIVSADDAATRAALKRHTLSACSSANLFLFSARKPAR